MDYINRIFNIECIAGMSMYPDKSINMILCDLPYGMTDCRWDSTIPFDLLWKQYLRIIKDIGAIVLTSCQPFTTKAFKPHLIVDKVVELAGKGVAAAKQLKNSNQLPADQRKATAIQLVKDCLTAANVEVTPILKRLSTEQLKRPCSHCRRQPLQHNRIYKTNSLAGLFEQAREFWHIKDRTKF